LNKTTKTKGTKKQINEDIKKIREFLKPFSLDFKKTKKNVELLQIIFGLEPKSEMLELIFKIVLDKKLQISEITDTQVSRINKIMLKFFRGEFEESIRKEKICVNKNVRAYIELVTGTKPKMLDILAILEKNEHVSHIGIKKLKVKYGSFEKIPDEKLQRVIRFKEKLKITNKQFYDLVAAQDLVSTAIMKKILIFTKDKKRILKQTTEEKEKESAAKNVVKKLKDRTNETLLGILKKEREVENKIEKISNLKNVCETCYQKVSKTYQKNTLKKMETKKKQIIGTKKMIKSLVKIGDELQFKLDKGEYLPFKEAKMYVNMLMIKSQKEWHQYAVLEKKLPVNIPKYPDIEYSSTEKEGGWVSWSDWLGVKPKKLRNFKEARDFVRKMKLKNYRDWKKAINSGMLPADIPRDPHRAYRKDWKDAKDFFKIN